MGDRIKYPTRGEYRGVPLFAGQDAATLEIVRRHIDEAAALPDVAALFEFAADREKAPEARLLAGARIRAEFEIAIERRASRPIVDLEKLTAILSGLDTMRLDHEGVYRAEMFQPGLAPGQVIFCRKTSWTREEIAQAIRATP